MPDSNSLGAGGKSLPELRAEIRELTKSILALVEARQTLSLQIAEIKSSAGEKIENTQVEQDLVASLSEYSQRIGLDPELGKNIVQLLIEYSKIAQTGSTFRKKIQAFLEAEKIRTVSIVGAGRMGTWFAKYFGALGLPVTLYDEDLGRAKSIALEHSFAYAEELAALDASDLIVVAVPIVNAPGIIREISRIIAQKISKKIRILEISSVKSELAKSGLDKDSFQNMELYSVHPLFGAGANMYARNSILQVAPEDPRLVKGLFPHYYVESLNWKAHDELMASLLTIPHSLALVFADLLVERNRAEGRNFSMKTPSFSHMLELSRRVLGENPEVYFEIEAANPNTDRALSDLLASINKLRKSLESREEFISFFTAARKAAVERDSV